MNHSQSVVKFSGDISMTCSLVNLIGWLEEKSGDQWSQRIWAEKGWVGKIHPNADEILQSGLKCWTDRLISAAIKSYLSLTVVFALNSLLYLCLCLSLYESISALCFTAGHEQVWLVQSIDSVCHLHSPKALRFLFTPSLSTHTHTHTMLIRARSPGSCWGWVKTEKKPCSRGQWVSGMD